jgi:deoxyribonuclease-4
MLTGAHVSTAGGVTNAIGRAQGIGAECMQIFASSPRMWAAKVISEKDGKAFQDGVAAAGLGPTVLHAKYLVALGAADEALLEKSITALIADMKSAEALGALGVIFHPASHRGQGLDAVFDQFVRSIGRILEEAPGKALLMLETSAGSGDHIGSKFTDLGRLIKATGSPRVAACLDTQHVWAAGYNVADKVGLDDAIKEWDAEIGLDKLRAVHANDSKRPLGSAVDRHDNIGEGDIGEAGFKTILAHPAFKEVPFYLEVPGVDGSGPDKHNVDALKRIRDAVTLKS